MLIPLKFQSNQWDQNLEIFARLPSGETIGHISGQLDTDTLIIGSVFVEPDQRGQGVGLGLYEELFRLAAGLGARWIMSLEPSEAALRVHKQLAEKYGLPLHSARFPNPF